MSEKQPEALFHAEWLDRTSIPDAWRAASEIRRLHDVNTDLLDALRDMVSDRESLGKGVVTQAIAAIAKATKGQE